MLIKYSCCRATYFKLWHTLPTFFCIYSFVFFFQLILAVLIFKKGFYLKTKDMEELSPDNYKAIWDKLQLQPTVILFSMMQINYLLNFIMREYRVTTTFFWQSEGLGYYQIVSSALYPFYFTTISKFVADADITLSNNILIVSAVVYVLGFLLMLLSNNIKHEFRKNPLQPNLMRKYN